MDVIFKNSWLRGNWIIWYILSGREQYDEDGVLSEKLFAEIELNFCRDLYTFYTALPSLFHLVQNFGVSIDERLILLISRALLTF